MGEQPASSGVRDHSSVAQADPVTVVHDVSHDAAGADPHRRAPRRAMPREHRWVTEWSQ